MTPAIQIVATSARDASDDAIVDALVMPVAY
jgi:hypothetical protein